ncbi:MAG: hypothetical protein KF823_02310 [Xanthomonadales bacterium]|nr:hypothetical protein [Xanthomonadales bacterium]
MIPDVNQRFPVEEVEDGHTLARALFRRRYRLEIPDFPLHVVGFWVDDQGSRHPACYIHWSRDGDILLGGGACSDDRLLRRLPAADRQALRTVGGIYRHTLVRSLAIYADRCSALFGYSGDALAIRETCAAGFEPTGHPHLLVHFPRPLPPERRRELIAQAHAIGPF